MNDKPTIEVGKVPIITKFIYTLGVLPTSYLMSMTYQEQVTWLCNYIQQTLIPQINEDVEAIQELQNLYELLRTYVNDYFDNTDFQQMVDNKIDEMVSDGTLSNIINQELFTNLENKINEVDSNVLTDIVIIGDSYTALPGSTWANDVASQLNLTLHKFAQSSMGYVHQINNQTFIDLIPDSPSYANKVKYVICYGGINDFDATRSQIESNVTAFITKAKNTFPNAQILIVGPQHEADKTDTITQRYEREVIGIERACIKSGVSFTDASKWLINTEFLYTDTYSSDRLHPSSLGYKIIASKMLSIINNDINDNTKIKVSIFEGNTGVCHYTNSENHTHFTAKLTDVAVTKGAYTSLLRIYGMADVDLTTNFEGYLDRQQYFPVYQYDSSNNVTKFVGCARVAKRSADNSYVINLVGIVDTFTGNIVISGDLYYNFEQN